MSKPTFSINTKKIFDQEAKLYKENTCSNISNKRGSQQFQTSNNSKNLLSEQKCGSQLFKSQRLSMGMGIKAVQHSKIEDLKQQLLFDNSKIESANTCSSRNKGNIAKYLSNPTATSTIKKNGSSIYNESPIHSANAGNGQKQKNPQSYKNTEPALIKSMNLSNNNHSISSNTIFFGRKASQQCHSSGVNAVQQLSTKVEFKKSRQLAQKNAPFPVIINEQCNKEASSIKRTKVTNAYTQPHSTKSQIPKNMFSFNDKEINNRLQDYTSMSCLPQSQQFSMTPSHVNHSRQHINFRYSTDTVNPITQRTIQQSSGATSQRLATRQDYQHYYCETGGSLDHRISPLHSQNSIVVQSAANDYISRPQSNIALVPREKSSAFIKNRPSFDRSAIQVLAQSHRAYSKLEGCTQPHEPKRQTPSEPDEDSDYSDVESERNDQFMGSAVDTVATASLVEGNTTVKLPQSQITKATVSHSQNAASNTVLKSIKSTERYQKPFVRPQINSHDSLNQPFQNVLERNRKSISRGMKYRNPESNANSVDKTIKEMSSRSQSPVSNVHTEYFQAQHSKVKKSTKSVEKARNINIVSIFEQLCFDNDIIGLQKLINKDKNYLKQVISQRRTLLYKAIELQNPLLLKYLLTEHQIIKNDQQNYNLLHIATKNPTANQHNNNKELEIVKTILAYDKYASLDCQDTYGNTPIHMACQNQKFDILEFFLKNYTPSLQLRNSEGKTPLHYCPTQSAFINLFVEYISKLRQEAKKNRILSKELKIIETELLIDKDLQLSFQEITKLFQNSKIAPTSKQPGLKPASRNTNYISDGVSSYSKNVCVTEPSLQQHHMLQSMNDLSSSKPLMTLGTISERQDLLVKHVDNLIITSFDDEDEPLEYCEQIEEASDESLHHSLIKQSLERVGPESFEPISLIGQGSFGEVYLVRKKDSSQKLYAMKILQKEKIMGQNLVKYAVTERNVLSITKHPFIVGLNYAFQTKDKLFLILDYCPGGDLGKVLGREKRFNEERARLYLAEVLLALEDLHKRDIIFRDLKPDNVVLDEEGHALLTDFGLSKQGVLDNQGAKSFCGSVAYLAPEMLKRIGHGKSVDWYLLGVLLYEMLVGIPPYFTNNKEKLFQNIQRGPLLIPAQLSTEAKGLIIGLLSKNPVKRLGAVRDAEEIKEHPFFEGINWTEVLKRKLSPPKPDIQKVNPLSANDMQAYAQIIKDEFEQDMRDSLQCNADEYRLQGWSFAGSAQHMNVVIIK